MLHVIVKDRDLLEWMLQQDMLRIEKWHHPGGRESASVWTALDDEDEPSGRGATVRDALVQAFHHQKSLV